MAIEQPYATRQEALAAFAAHVNRGKVRFFEAMFAAAGGPLVLGERAGARFRDAYPDENGDDRWYWNCHSNGGVFNLGHRHPAVIAALRDALGSLDIGNHHLVSGLRARLAARLAASTGGQLPGVVFGVSGGEANDLAIKVARAHTRRQTIVSASGGYHGHTGLALATGDAPYRRPFGPQLPGFVQVPWDDLDAMARAVDNDTAAVILETIPATLGMPLPRPGYLAEVASLCRARGALLILDEVQTGLGRTGAMWAWEHEGVVPDMMSIGKGLSGGLYPITATLMSAPLHAFFDEHPFVHVSTFGGAELGCAAASAVLDVVEAPGFLERVRALGERFRRGLGAIPGVTLRQRGLFMGLALPREGDGVVAVQRLLARGVFALFAANDTRVVQLLPPLILDDHEADAIIARVCEALS